MKYRGLPAEVYLHRLEEIFEMTPQEMEHVSFFRRFIDESWWRARTAVRAFLSGKVDDDESYS